MMSHYKYAEVALPVPIFKTFTYSIPEEFLDTVQTGMSVLVPFGARKMTGYIIKLHAVSSLKEVKPIEDIVDAEPVFSTEMFRLAQWISEYYICPFGEVLKAMVPSGFNQESETLILLTEKGKLISRHIENMTSVNQKAVLKFLLAENKTTIQKLKKSSAFSNLYFTIHQLEKSGFLQKMLILHDRKAKPKIEKWVKIDYQFLPHQQIETLIHQLEQKAPQQSKIIKYLLHKEEVSQQQILTETGVSAASLRALTDKKYIERFDKELIRSYQVSYPVEQNIQMNLNEDQFRAVEAISNAIEHDLFTVFLLFGVTGSGKTQVYIEALRKVLLKGATAIILVPEISLTPQTVSRFTANFPNLVAVLHSRMSVGERYDSWRKIKEGQYKIVIGPRSAIFAPLQNIGLIVVDEEHEASYKQYDSSPHYHARDVAIVRGKLNEAVVVLGSATPSVESFYNVKVKKYDLLQLPARIDNIPMPKVTVIDFRNEPRKTIKGDLKVISNHLKKKIAEKLQRNEQIILLQNRRGFSSFIMCQDCGHIEKCVNCDITLTYHISVHRLRCHYCNYIKKAPDVCPKCHSRDIIFQGIGTQRVEIYLQDLFPEARIVRMDLDTTVQKRSHEKILRDFAHHKFDILLGTQMVAKGLDFRKVTLVGVISADTALYLPDFRASERTFQLLTQVAGRAGRKELTGEVIIQTVSPHNYGLICAQSHDFIKFFAHEIQNRKELNYPPFSRLVQILLQGEEEQRVIEMMNVIHSELPIKNELYQVLGPVPSPILKIKKYYRWQIILKVSKKADPSGKMTSQILYDLMSIINMSSKKNAVKITINVDPASLL